VARPLKEGMDYFPHDTDASNDEKIEALRALHGNDGYAFYFITLERIYRTHDGELDISKPAILAALVKKIGVSQEKFNQMLETAFDVEAFDRSEYEARHVLTSRGIKRRFKEVQAMRDRWRRKKEENAPSELVFSGENPGENQEENLEETGESKEKKSKEKKSINITPPISLPIGEDHSHDDQCLNGHSIRDDQCSSPRKTAKVKYAEFVSMTEKEYQALIDRFGESNTKRMIEVLDNYKGAHGRRYKSDYRAILTWVVDRIHEKKSQNGAARDSPKEFNDKELADQLADYKRRMERFT